MATEPKNPNGPMEYDESSGTYRPAGSFTPPVPKAPATPAAPIAAVGSLAPPTASAMPASPPLPSAAPQPTATTGVPTPPKAVLNAPVAGGAPPASMTPDPVPAAPAAPAVDPAWQRYTQGGGGPANGSITSPNGDVIHFDPSGVVDYTTPHAGSGTDADVNHDPLSQFNGFTNTQLGQYGAAQGVQGILTDALRANPAQAKTGGNALSATGANTYDTAQVAASDAALKAGAATDPMVQAAIQNSLHPPQAPVEDPAAFAARAAKEHQDALTAASLASGWNAPGMKYDGQAGHYDNTNSAPIPAVGSMGSAAPAAPTSNLTPGAASDVHGTGQLPLNPPPLATSATGNPQTGSGSTPVTATGETTFGPGNDLRSTQINPVASDRQTALNSMVDKAAGAVGNGASRGTIAQNYLDAFDTQAQPQIRDQIRAVGQRAAQLGRLGMGDTAIEATKPYTDYLTQRAGYAKQLAGDSAAGDISDRLNSLGALNSTQGQIAGQDASNRNELRTERGYQTQTAQQAIQDEINQFLMQQQAQQQNFNQGATLAGIGYGNNPASTYLNAGQSYGANAGMDFSNLAALLSPYLNRQTTATK